MRHQHYDRFPLYGRFTGLAREMLRSKPELVPVGWNCTSGGAVGQVRGCEKERLK